MNLESVPGLDLASGTFTVPLWVVGVAAAVIVALIVIAVVRAGMNEFGSLVFRAAVIVIAVVLGWTYVNRSAERDRADERRALDQRAAELVSRAASPGSATACLEATNTETVEGACERAVFATPEAVAAATAYVSARLTLLADATNTRRGATRDTSPLSPGSGARLRPTATGLPPRSWRRGMDAQPMHAMRSGSFMTTRSCARTSRTVCST